jgi:glycosyltransferase involved in cell wall biosynthesis
MSAERIRIVYMIDALGFGGAEHQLVCFLRHLNPDRYAPTVCVLSVRQGNMNADEIRQSGIDVELIPVRRLLDPQGFKRLKQHLRARQPAIVHTHLDFSTILGGTACRRLGIPHVATLHTMEQPPRHSRAMWRQRFFYRSLNRSCDQVISVSQSVREHHLTRSGLDPGKVVTIHNGIDTQPFTCRNQAEREAVRRSLNIPSDAPVITAVAVLRPAKGVQHLIDALPTMMQAVPEIRLLVVGSGPNEPALRTQAGALGVAERITFTGHRDDVPRLLTASDLFVLPTLRDSLPTVIIEAMAAGTPVVASDVGGVSEMIEDGVTGLLVPPSDPSKLADACLRLLNQPKLSSSIAQAARHAANQRFGIDVHVKRVTEVYEKLLAQHTGLVNS